MNEIAVANHQAGFFPPSFKIKKETTSFVGIGTEI